MSLSALSFKARESLALRFQKTRIRMTSFFPDLNVWLALSVAGHSHSADAWKWANLLPPESKLIFCRYTK
jgi:hypothetical protein